MTCIFILTVPLSRLSAVVNSHIIITTHTYMGDKPDTKRDGTPEKGKCISLTNWNGEQMSKWISVPAGTTVTVSRRLLSDPKWHYMVEHEVLAIDPDSGCYLTVDGDVDRMRERDSTHEYRVEFSPRKERIAAPAGWYKLNVSKVVEPGPDVAAVESWESVWRPVVVWEIAADGTVTGLATDWEDESGVEDPEDYTIWSTGFWHVSEGEERKGEIERAVVKHAQWRADMQAEAEARRAAREETS